ncbi:hypothetical protein OESDEN_24807 [Oesophagostomum dentatum]|uniref:Uncharacterized protein n=1 Tax=Oesophagostomum dentatum TaxID=61180 RepID=A0A0B1RWN5_OESDE|nr:hypothetical protein OESDEN_24807 [Oesophagostomum dentatum]
MGAKLYCIEVKVQRCTFSLTLVVRKENLLSISGKLSSLIWSH